MSKNHREQGNSVEIFARVTFNLVIWSRKINRPGYRKFLKCKTCRIVLWYSVYWQAEKLTYRTFTGPFFVYILSKDTQLLLQTFEIDNLGLQKQCDNVTSCSGWRREVRNRVWKFFFLSGLTIRTYSTTRTERSNPNGSIIILQGVINETMTASCSSFQLSFQPHCVDLSRSTHTQVCPKVCER